MGFGANNINCPQRQMVIQSVKKSGLASPVLSGSCANMMTVVANGIGDYTITFLRPFAQIPEVMVTDTSATIHVCTVAAVTINSVQILTNTGLGADDGDFHLLVIGSLAVDLIG